MRWMTVPIIPQGEKRLEDQLLPQPVNNYRVRDLFPTIEGVNRSIQFNIKKRGALSCETPPYT